MLKVCIQAGHLNIKTNCDVALRSGTGAGGEVEVNMAVRDALAPLLETKGIQVQRVDANFNCDPTSLDTDWNLFLALHCDMDYPGDMGSGFCDFPEPSTDSATLESQRIAKEIQSSFFSTVGIAIKSRSNANTRYYYMWNSVSAKTPCVLIEMGQVKDPHDSIILHDTQKVANALANAIFTALGIDISPPSATSLTELDEMRLSRDRWKKDFKDLEELHMTLKTDYAKAQADLEQALRTIEILKVAIQTNKTPLSFYTWTERFKSLFS
jgi:hypothetical protein